MPKPPEYPRDITVPPGIEINGGRHEDGESFITNGPTTLRIVGPLKDGAFPVHIIENGEELPNPFFYHQPEKKSSP